MVPTTENAYVIYCVDGPCDNIVSEPNGGRRRGGVHRMSCMDEHNAYQLATSSPNHECYIHKIAAVPMLAQDGVTMIGSCFLIQASREECERFIQSDPLFVEKVWDSVTINKFSEASKSQTGNPLATTKKAPGAPRHFQVQRV